MTKLEMGDLIANECEWSRDHNPESDHLYRTKDGRGMFNPATCLNAMHEAEKVLDFCQFDRYRCDLWLAVGNKDVAFEACAPLRCLRAFVQATADQRAEAFLRTLGKWTD